MITPFRFIPEIYFDKYFRKINGIRNPEYLIVGEIEKKYLIDPENINNYRKVYSNNLYNVYKINN